MRTLFLLLSWYSVGLGVVAVYNYRHDRDQHLDGMPIAAPILWPAYVTAEIYRAVAPPLTNHPEVIPGEAVTSRKD